MGIENNFGVPKKENKKINLDDVFLFGALLSSAFVKLKEGTGKTKTEIARELGVDISTLNHWEDGTSFPGEIDKNGKPIGEVLVLIADIYGIDIEQLRKAYMASKSAREKEKESLKSLRSKGKEEKRMDGVWGEGGSTGRRVAKNGAFSSSRSSR